MHAFRIAARLGAPTHLAAAPARLLTGPGHLAAASRHLLTAAGHHMAAPAPLMAAPCHLAARCVSTTPPAPRKRRTRAQVEADAAAEATTRRAALDRSAVVGGVPAGTLHVPSVAELRQPRPPLAVEYPELAAEWHPSRNGALTPADVNVFTRAVVWWRCSDGHEWAEPVRARLGRAWRHRLLSRLGLQRLDASDDGAEEGGAAAAAGGGAAAGGAAVPTAAAGAGAPPPSLSPTPSLSSPPSSPPPPPPAARAAAKYDLSTLSPALAELVTEILEGDKHSCYTRGWGLAAASGGTTAAQSPAGVGFGPIAKQWETDATAFGVAWSELRNLRADRSPSPLERCATKGWTTALLRSVYRPQPCPCCSARRSAFSYEKSLAAARPDLAAALHPVLNGDLHAKDLAQWSSIDVWWRCGVSDDHVWRGPVYEQARRGARPAAAAAAVTRDKDSHHHAHAANGASCAFCQGRYPDRNNNVAVTAPAILPHYDTLRNSRPPVFATATETSLQRYWWRVSAAAPHAILLPTPTALQFEEEGLWAPLAALLATTPASEVARVAHCSEREWLTDGGIGPSTSSSGATAGGGGGSGGSDAPPASWATPSDFTLASLAAAWPPLPYYAPISAADAADADGVFLARDMSGSMHQVGDHIRSSLRQLVRLLMALQEWQGAHGADAGSGAAAVARDRFHALVRQLTQSTADADTYRRGVEEFRNLRRVSAMNARKKRLGQVAAATAAATAAAAASAAASAEAAAASPPAPLA